MAASERWSAVKARLRHCNVVVTGVVLAIIGLWSEIRPTLQELLSDYLAPNHVNAILTVIGLAILIYKAVPAAMKKPEDQG